MKSRHTALAAAGLCLALTPAFSASGPDWWATYGVLESGQGGDNWSPVNVGQLKHVASRAKAYLDAEFPGGAGTAVDNMVAGFSQNDPENFAPANIGQLKQVASVFYARLDSEFRYGTAGGLMHRGADAGSISETYPTMPWGEAASAENWRPANIGQLKLVFSFDIGFLQAAAAAQGDDTDAAGDGFAGFVSYYAGFPNDAGIYHSAEDAAGWQKNADVEQAMSQADGLVYIVLPDQGPFVATETSDTVEGTDVDLVNIN